MLHGAPLFAQGRFLPVIQTAGFRIEPRIDLVFRPERLVNVAGFIDEVAHDFILHCLTEFVSVDVAAEDLQAGLLILLEQRRAGEANVDGVGQDGFHDAVQFAALGAVALVHEYEDLAHSAAGLGFQFTDELIEIVDALAAEFVDQGTDEARLGLAEETYEVASAGGALNGFTNGGEHAFDLFIEFVAVGDDDDPGAGQVFQYPSGEQHHDDALAAALGVPDNAALAFAHVALGGLDAEILVDARQFFNAAIEEHEIVQQFDEPLLGAHLEQVLIELEAGVVLFVLLPLQEVLFFGTDSPVAQPFGIASGEDELHRAEEAFIEFGALVGKVLADAVADGYAAVLEFENAHGDAVDVEHDVRAAFVVAAKGDFLGDGEIVAERFRPVDEVDRFGALARFDLYWNAVTEETVHGLIVSVETARGVVPLRADCVDGFGDLGSVVAAIGKVLGQRGFFDIGVAVAVAEIAEVAIAEFVAEEGDDAVLGFAFGLADGGHEV